MHIPRHRVNCPGCRMVCVLLAAPPPPVQEAAAVPRPTRAPPTCGRREHSRHLGPGGSSCAIPGADLTVLPRSAITRAALHPRRAAQLTRAHTTHAMTVPTAPRPSASRLEEPLRSRRFVITAEIAPPVSCDADDLLAKALPLAGLADAVNVTDGASARAHMSAPIAAAMLVQNGIEPILQLTCRDRNRIALQADLMGAAATGRAQPAAADRRRSQGRRPARDQAGVRRRFRHAHRDGARHARPGRAADRPQDRRARRASSSAQPTCRSTHRPAGSRQACRQDRGRRGVRADPVLHGCGVVRRYAAAARGARGDARPLSAHRHRAAALGQIGALDEGAPSAPSFPTTSSTRLERGQRSGGGRPAHLHRPDRGIVRIPGVAGVHIMAPANEAAVPAVIGAARERLPARPAR